MVLALRENNMENEKLLQCIKDLLIALEIKIENCKDCCPNERCGHQFICEDCMIVIRAMNNASQILGDKYE